MFAEQFRLEAARVAAVAEQRKLEERQRKLAEQQYALEQQQRQAAQERALLLEDVQRQAAADQRQQALDEQAAQLAQEQQAADTAATEAAIAEAATTEAIDSFDRIAPYLASGRTSVVAPPTAHGSCGSVALDMAAVESNSASRHSLAWKLRRRRESLSGEAYSSPTKRGGVGGAPPPKLASPYPLPHATSTPGAATPRLAV